MTKKIKKNLPRNQIRTTFKAESLNEENRTVDVVWSTGSRGLRHTWFGSYYEELSLDPDHVDLSRLNDGTHPLLAAHDSSNLDSVIGVIERAWLEDGKAVATVRFAKDEISERAFQKVRDGILSNISVGYDVDEYTELDPAEDDDDETPIYRATRWVPMEVSIVPIGFDPAAKIRSQNEIASHEVVILTRGSQEPNGDNEMKLKRHMLLDKASDNGEGGGSAKPQNEVNLDEVRAKAAEAEQTRCFEIRNYVKTNGLLEDLADDLIKRNASVEESKKIVDLFKKNIEASRETKVDNTTRVSVGETHEEKRREAIENALMHRLDSSVELKSGRDFRGMSLIRICEELVGGRKGMTDVELAKRAMTTSDFPLILANLAEKSLAARYQTAPETFSQWTRKGKLRNYKQHSQVRIGDFPSLSERNEEGEFTYGSVGESNELVKLKKYGKILAFSEELLIGDDLGALGDFVQQAGNAARRLESKLVYDVIMTNPAMADTKNLFSNDHSNLGSAGALAEATFAELRRKLMAQKTVDGEDFLDIAPKYILCGPLMEVAVNKFLSTIVPSKTDEVNIFAKSVIPVVDNRITDYRYILTADPAQYDTVTLFHLEGAEAPRVSTRNKWESGAFEIKVEHAAAAKAMDFRGMAANLYTGPQE